MKKLFSLPNVIDFSVGFLISSVTIFMIIVFIIAAATGGAHDQISLR